MRLFPDCEVIVDAIRFEQLARAAVAEGDPGRRREALAWYRGELLPGDRYADWAMDRVGYCTYAGSTCCGSPANGGSCPSSTRPTRRRTCS